MKYFFLTRFARFLRRPQAHGPALLLALVALLGSQRAQAQVTLSEFKIDNATAVKFYTTSNTTRTANFTVKASRPISSVDIPNIRIYLVGYNPENQLSAAVSMTGNWSYNNTGTAMVATYTGSFQLIYATTGFGNYTGLQAINFVGINAGNRSSVIPITYISNPNTAITLTNYRINDPTTSPNNGLSVNVNSVSRNVTASVTLSKDAGYTDEFLLRIGGNNAAGITTTYQTVSSAWTLNSTGQKTCSVSWPFSVSTSNVAVQNTQLLIQAVTSSSGLLLGTGTSTVAINRLADPPSTPCISDVFLQNVTFTGTKSSGQDLYAGRAVTSGTAGDVVILSGATATFNARKTIALLDGFSAQAGSTFSAYPDGAACSSLVAGDTSAAPSYRLAQGPKLQAPAQSQEVASVSVRLETADVYPNPATSQFDVNLPNNGSERTLHIYNGMGYEVKRTTLAPGQTTVDIRSLAPGVYNLMSTSEGASFKAHFRVVR
ncbi:MAG: hypothetical protein JWP58_539 [Hymenobacter sp.]|nr:hypothetical protein [Hymenobacter sp.]